VSDGEPRDEEVAAALQRLLSWPEIARSGQLAKFLSYIVERKLGGDAQSIKAYSIAVDVFGRPVDFDPQSDPIVRVQARRLRGLLAQFYSEAGAGEDIRIALPKGRYVPEFTRRDPILAEETGEVDMPAAGPVPPGRHGGLPVTWFVLAVLTLVGAALAFILSNWALREGVTGRADILIDRPSVTITEFQSLTGDRADLGIAAGLAIELVTDLEHFETIAVHYGGSNAASGPAAADDYVLSGIVRREAGGLQYSAILTETASGSVVWNHAIALDAGKMARIDLLNQVSDRLSLVLGNPRGPLHRRARALVAENPAISGGESLYLCRVLFDLYRESGSATAAGQAEACFAALRADERQSGPALAAMGSLMAETASAATNVQERLAEAAELLDAAVQVAPVSAFVWEQRARFFELVGQHDLAEAAYSTTYQLNPSNTDAIAARARHFAFMGRQESAARLAVPLIADSPDPPAWYFCVPALEALRRGQYQLAVDYAGIYAEADREVGPILAVMAGQGLRDADVVNRYLPRVLDLASFRSRGILTQLRQRISDETLLRDMRAALLSAGVPAAALNGAF
jgi:TolB-like protein